MNNGKIFSGRLSKKQVFALPQGAILITNGTGPGGHPLLMEELGPESTREELWKRIKAVGWSWQLGYAFSEWRSCKTHISRFCN